MKKISVIVPVRYRADLTRVCIDSILNYTEDVELIVVQEGEDEEVCNLIKEYPEVKKAWNIKPKGYSGALNAGLKIATGEYICFMNNDTVVTPGWMDHMLKAFDDEECGLVVPTFWGSGDLQSVDWNDGREFSYVNSIYNIIGVCFVIPRKVLDIVGEWDESFFHGGEDFDIAHRIDQAGYNIQIARKSFIYHYGGASTRELFDHDIVKIKENVLKKLQQFADKHSIDVETIYEKLNKSKRI